MTECPKKLKIKNRRGNFEGIAWLTGLHDDVEEVSFTDGSHGPDLTTPAQCRKVAGWLNAVADYWEDK